MSGGASEPRVASTGLGLEGDPVEDGLGPLGAAHRAATVHDKAGHAANPRTTRPLIGLSDFLMRLRVSQRAFDRRFGKPGCARTP